MNPILARQTQPRK